MTNTTLHTISIELEKASIAQIANQISLVMKKEGQKAPHAVPYLEAMFSLDSIDDRYYLDSGRSIVAYFLGNAQTLKGEAMREIKKELNKRLK